MKKQDFMFTGCREIEYDAASHKEKSILYGVDCLLLDGDSNNMGGMDCMVAYIITEENKAKFEEGEWETYQGIDTIQSHFHISYEKGVRDYLCEILKEHKVIIIEEERCYLRPHSREGANFLKLKEQANLLKLVANPVENENYHFYRLPKAYENYGRVVFNYQLFMSGL